MMTELDLLIRGAKDFGISLNERQLSLFDLYLSELKTWNDRVRLVSNTDTQAVIVDHFIDSLSCFSTGLLEGDKKVIDIGAGAGFPAIPCAIANRRLAISLVEATLKKSEFLSALTASLGLEGAEVLGDRAEALAHLAKHREQYDIAVVRAVGGLSEVAELCLPFVRVGGSMIAQKGRRQQAEIEIGQAEAAIAKLGGGETRLVIVDSDIVGKERTIVVVSKTKATQAKYPRRPGLPHKRPLV